MCGIGLEIKFHFSLLKFLRNLLTNDIITVPTKKLNLDFAWPYLCFYYFDH